tara:strand:- start:91 stop:483 length:393 start_codon:yes stop_codon:yes gene_type:complete
MDCLNKDRNYPVLKYFTRKEFECPTLAGSGDFMDSAFLHQLDQAREFAQIPFKITSGYRSESHNNKVGGVKGSSHCKGLAADIYIRDSVSRYKILTALIKAKFTRIGIGEYFIHVDSDTTKTSNVCWQYY